MGSVEHGHTVVAGMGEEKFERAEGVSWKTFGFPRIRTHDGDKTLTPYYCPPGTIWATCIKRAKDPYKGIELTKQNCGSLY